MDEIRKRFWPKVRLDDSDCWIWMGGVDNRGYGQIGVSSHRTERVHRVSYMLHFKHIPRGASVLHHCDNKLCVNPDHLYLGSQTQNVKDAVKRGRFPPHPFRKLTREQADKCRTLHNTGEYSTYKLADIFEVSRGVIRNVVERGMYKN